MLAFFVARPDGAWSPEQVHRAVMPRAPLTSARRAITNLTAKGLLEKTDERASGLFGRPVHLWRLVPDEPVQRSLPFGRSP